MVISDTDLAIEDSVFSGLSFFGDAGSLCHKQQCDICQCDLLVQQQFSW